jgi:hypothetical protein
MLFTSPIASQASGSLGGLVFAHNRGGQYIRRRVTPTDPASQRQMIVRNILTILASAWGTVLDADQREAWNTYAANVAMTNRLGQTIYLTGQQHFVRCNVPRTQAGIVILLDAPEVYDLGTFTPPTLEAAYYDDDQFSIGFTNTDAWAVAVGGHLLVYGGKPMGPGRAFYRGPFRFGGKVDGAVSPPTSPATIDSAYDLTEDNQAWVQCRIIQVDGRLSAPILLGPVTTEAAP